MKQKLLILSVLLILVAVVMSAWWRQAIKPLNETQTEPVTFVVSPGEGVRSIADRLQKDELIRSSVAFFLYVRAMGYDNILQAGEFRLNPSMSMTDITENLTHGSIDIWVTIPEGWRNAQIAQQISKDLSIPEAEFLKEAKEGYMFPDTYLVPKDATAAGVAALFHENFSKKVTPGMIAQAEARGLSLDELVIVASLVEREARLAEDRPLVASVILNRLDQDMKLDIDATIQYALGYQPAEKVWWKKDLTVDDLVMEHPYNTYKIPGLPPGPIANPGLAAIQAVINAPSNDYIFYLADSKGKSHFARTLEEHNANISKYLGR